MAAGTHPEAQISVTLTADLLERIDALAESAGLTRAELIRQAIHDLLEDAEDIAVSEARLADTDDPVVPWEEVDMGVAGRSARGHP